MLFIVLNVVLKIENLQGCVIKQASAKEELGG